MDPIRHPRPHAPSLRRLRAVAAASLVLALAVPAHGAEDEEVRPAWLEVHRLSMRAAKAALTGPREELGRAKAFGIQAQEYAGDNPALRGVAALATALAELARGDAEAFARHVDRAAADLPLSAALTGIVLQANAHRAAEGDREGAHESLTAYLLRLEAGGADRSEDAAAVERARRELDRPAPTPAVAKTSASGAPTPAAAPDLPPLGDATEIHFYPLE